MGPSVTLQDVRRAQGSIAHLVLKTPMLAAHSLGGLAGCERGAAPAGLARL